MEQETNTIPEEAVLLDEEQINEVRAKSANNKWMMVGAIVVLSVIVLMVLIVWLLNGMYSNMDGEIDASLQEIDNLQDDIDLESMSELENIEEPEQELDEILNDLDSQLDQIQNELDLEDFSDPAL